MLTKADLVQSADVEQWLKVIHNEAHVLRRGYYLTRLPPNTETSPAWKAALEAEVKCLTNKKSPWSHVKCKNRLGTMALLKALSDSLEEIIKDRYFP